MLRNYLTIAYRTLWHNRLYTLLNVTGLAVGMAGGLLIFAFLRHHLSTDRHHAHYDRIVRVSTDLHLEDGTVDPDAGGPPLMAAYLRTNYSQVEQAAFLTEARQTTVAVRQFGRAKPTRFLEYDGVSFVEPEWFDVLTYTWLHGDPKKALRGPNQAVLTASWANRYFGTANPLGQTLTLNAKATVTVVGVVADPPGPTDTEVGLFVSWPTMRQFEMPAGFDTDWAFINSTSRVYARLKDPESLASLQAAMPSLSKRQFGKSAHIYHFVVQPFADLHFDVVRDGVKAIRPTLLWVLGLIGLLLVGTACINVVNLATAQALRRSKEVGIRKTMGSSRGQLMGQFLLETALIVGTALLLAALLTGAALPVFANWTRLPLSLRPDGWLLGFVGTLAVGVVVLAGGYPAFVLAGFSPFAALRGQLRMAKSSFTVRQVLVVAQFVVCNALIVGALVIIWQTQYIQEADLGYHHQNVVLVKLPYGQKAAHDAFKQQLLHYAGVRAVSLSSLEPSRSGPGGSFKFDGKADWEKYVIWERLADADYLKTYGLKLLAGRNISPGDTIRDYVINQSLMRKLGFRKPEQAIGRRLQYWQSNVPLPIVGVVRDFHQAPLQHQIEPCILVNRAEWYRVAGIRLAGQNPTQTLRRIEQAYEKTFPNDVFEYQFVDEDIARFYQTETLMARLINVFTALAILICCLGLYGLVAQAVVQRTKEIGVRKVLGASVGSIVALLSKDFLKLVLVAIVIASPLAGWAMNRWLQGFAYRISLHWWLFAGAGTLVIAIALLTVSFQSIRAALMNPVKSLRRE